MKVDLMHYEARQSLSALQEFQGLNGDLRFWTLFRSLFLSRFKDVYAAHIQSRAREKIVAEAQSLSSKLEDFGFSERELLLVKLRQLEALLNPKLDISGILLKDKSGKICLPDIDASWIPLKKSASQGGAPLKNLALYYLLPGLVVYTRYICGKPKWALIARLIEQEFNMECGDIKRWWAENIKILTETKYQNMDSIRRQHISSSLHSYILLPETSNRAEPQGMQVFAGGIPLKGAKKDYSKIAIKLCPFLKKEIVGWRSPVLRIRPSESIVSERVWPPKPSS